MAELGRERTQNLCDYKPYVPSPSVTEFDDRIDTLLDHWEQARMSDLKLTGIIVWMKGIESYERSEPHTCHARIHMKIHRKSRIACMDLMNELPNV